MNLSVDNLKIESFFKWWLSELADMLPNSRAIPVKNSQRRINIVLTEDGYELNWENEKEVERVSSQFSSDQALKKYKQAIEANKKLNVNACNILLNEKMVLNRQVTLPLATEENLENVIAYEIDRYTPFKKEDVYFDAIVQSRNKSEKKINVLLRVLKKSAISELLAFVEESKLEIENIHCIDANSALVEGPLKFKDLVNSSASKSNKFSTNKYLLILVLTLAVASLLFPVAKNYWNAHKYISELESLDNEVIEVKQLLSSYRKMRNNIDLSASLNKNNVKVIVLLNELTAIIPDNTSLNKLSLEDGIVRIQGSSLSASKLIATLDAKHKFTDVRFAAPVTQNSSSGKENFTIEMKLKNSEDSNAAVK